MANYTGTCDKLGSANKDEPKKEYAKKVRPMSGPNVHRQLPGLNYPIRSW